MDTYSLFKTIHLLGVVLFLGNIIVTAWWKMMADRHGDPAVIAFAQRQVTLTDYVFTLGGIIILIIGANAMYSITNTSNVHWLFSDVYWISWGGWLFMISGTIWAIFLIPIQIKQARLAKQFEKGGDIPDQYWRLGRQWIFWGLLATILPLINLYWMVFKPQGA